MFKSRFSFQTKYNRFSTLLYREVINPIYCLLRRITLTAEPILVSFTVKPLKGPGKVNSFFGEGTSFLLFIILVDDKLFYLKSFQSGLMLSYGYL